MIGTMTYRGYTGTIDFCGVDGGFIGEVLGQPLISYEGDTLAALREDFWAAIDEYLENTEYQAKRRQNNEKKIVGTGIIPFPGSGALRPGPSNR
ncbi:hypothetical protein CE91St41_26820 [Oscillospiraceae bacterium]|nr:hypothetical protein CE91St40_10720 [Oscillospiraceae bacterium]BDF75793.1 hypothetical protein CE91St41_26820 [Oscillospiraceae bacterium]